MKFEESYEGWKKRRLTQEEAAHLLGVCPRTFRRSMDRLDRYEEAGLEGLLDRRLTQVSRHKAAVDEEMALADRYRSRHAGWSVRHFHAWYRRGSRTPCRRPGWWSGRPSVAPIASVARRRRGRAWRCIRMAVPTSGFRVRFGT